MLSGIGDDLVGYRYKKREEGEENYGKVDANAWLRSALHSLRSCSGHLFVSGGPSKIQSNGKRLRTPTLSPSFAYPLVLFRLLVCSIHLGHTPEKRLLGLGYALIAHLAVQIANRQFLFKTISGIGTECQTLRVCTQICRSTDWA